MDETERCFLYPDYVHEYEDKEHSDEVCLRKILLKSI